MTFGDAERPMQLLDDVRPEVYRVVKLRHRRPRAFDALLWRVRANHLLLPLLSPVRVYCTAPEPAAARDLAAPYGSWVQVSRLKAVVHRLL